MKALSLTQPWATLVAIGAKKIETRSWSTTYRGRIAIHAAKALAGMRVADFVKLCSSEPFRSALGSDGDLLVRGAVVATAFLKGVRNIQPRVDGDLDPADLTDEERAFGNYTTGRYAFIFDNVRAIPAPIPAKGALGLWEWDGIGVCRLCRCSESDACIPTCYWVEPDLCSECAPIEEGIFV